MGNNQRDTVFVTIVTNLAELNAVALLVHCLRTFGGEMKDVQGYILSSREMDVAGHFRTDRHIAIIPLHEKHSAEPYFFRSKVMACAQAERLTEKDGKVLIWLNPMTLLFKEPADFLLVGERKAAFRPVHIQNIGQEIGEPVDAYWDGIYKRVGRDADSYHLISFVDEKKLRPYFNSHLFAIDPALGIMQEWENLFNEMIQNEEFQRTCCADVPHRVFLHQAILSALIEIKLKRSQIHILPEEYSYPLHFHRQLNAEKQAHSLDELVCSVYEEGLHFPETFSGISVSPPLFEWLREQSGSV